MVAALEKWSPTSPCRRSEWNRTPSKATMPAASWPRCCKRMQPERGNGGGVGMIENAEDAALFAQSVAVGVEAGLARRVRG